MSKYTTEVRFICETKSGFTEEELELKSVDEVIGASRDKIFNFSYPIYEEEHRPVLETKILKHYYTREIGAETYALWRLWLNDKMNLIMPKYNKLYKAEHNILDKELKNIDVTTESLRTDDLLRTDNFQKDGTNSANEQGRRTDNLHTDERYDKHNARKYSDTPQGSVTFSELNQSQYWLTDYTEVDENGTDHIDNTGTQDTTNQLNGSTHETNTGNVANTGTQEKEIHELGYRGEKIYAELLDAYRDKIVNIDEMIVNELRDLFFKLW